MYDTISNMIKIAVDRWTSKSPKAAVYVTNISLVVGIAASILPYIPTVFPVTIPLWSIQLSSFLIALTAKMTKK